MMVPLQLPLLVVPSEQKHMNLVPLWRPHRPPDSSQFSQSSIGPHRSPKPLSKTLLKFPVRLRNMSTNSLDTVVTTSSVHEYKSQSVSSVLALTICTHAFRSFSSKHGIPMANEGNPVQLK
ncbi:hypothetical protein HanIR_Chr17g0883791 [Helianthus annuus]|nr:hypothetical protein HanIR_Chr17g0883671 [Helianthus annuus]KAJ0434621.1 hypothetical protein HanIR_Chr17g0883791 [Helianthus annuus]